MATFCASVVEDSLLDYLNETEGQYLRTLGHKIDDEA
jgi:hypothetical protein